MNIIASRNWITKRFTGSGRVLAFENLTMYDGNIEIVLEDPGLGLAKSGVARPPRLLSRTIHSEASPNSVALRICPAESSFTAYSGTSMRTNAPVSLTNAAAAVSTPQMTHTNNDARVALSAREYKWNNTNIDNRHNVINILSDNAKCAWLSKALSRATATDSVNARTNGHNGAKNEEYQNRYAAHARPLSLEGSSRRCPRLREPVDGTPETLDQLDELLVTLGASVGRS